MVLLGNADAAAAQPCKSPQERRAGSAHRRAEGGTRFLGSPATPRAPRHDAERRWSCLGPPPPAELTPLSPAGSPGSWGARTPPPARASPAVRAAQADVAVQAALEPPSGEDAASCAALRAEIASLQEAARSASAREAELRRQAADDAAELDRLRGTVDHLGKAWVTTATSLRNMRASRDALAQSLDQLVESVKQKFDDLPESAARRSGLSNAPTSPLDQSSSPGSLGGFAPASPTQLHQDRGWSPLQHAASPDGAQGHQQPPPQAAGRVQPMTPPPLG
eukprot:TRINITY_DN7998_c0_g1_i1.p1 TRINITY_DN7998_c0_g1~~TRINITY_DN7998_c0_g1_i1.p1  ORF type:complete len:279 (+),score=40.16 TRINITY_DN7998_c0_g1_i1:84-920(+)